MHREPDFEASANDDPHPRLTAVNGRHHALPQHAGPPQPPSPIPFPAPSPQDIARRLAANEEMERIAAELRHRQALDAAGKLGREQGYRLGYVEGWRWGAVCGAIASVCFAFALGLLMGWAGR